MQWATRSQQDRITALIYPSGSVHGPLPRQLRSFANSSCYLEELRFCAWIDPVVGTLKMKIKCVYRADLKKKRCAEHRILFN